MDSTKAYIICNEHILSFKALQKYLIDKKAFTITSLCGDIPNNFIIEIEKDLDEIKNQKSHSSSIYDNKFSQDYETSLSEEPDTQEKIETQAISSPEESTYMFEFEKFYYNMDKKENSITDDHQNVLKEEDDSDDSNEESYLDVPDAEAEFWHEWKSGDIERLGY